MHSIFVWRGCWGSVPEGPGQRRDGRLVGLLMSDVGVWCAQLSPSRLEPSCLGFKIGKVLMRRHCFGVCKGCWSIEQRV